MVLYECSSSWVFDLIYLYMMFYVFGAFTCILSSFAFES